MVSKQYQSISLDLGTTVPPMQEVTAAKHVDLSSAYPGAVLTYTIRVTNIGQRQLQVRAASNAPDNALIPPSVSKML
jgi:hypothetical protein